MVESHRSNLRDAILDTATELIHNEGIGNVTMSAVAKKTGISRQTLYKYFRDIDSMIVAFTERDSTRQVNELKASLAALSDPDAQLQAFLAASLDGHAHGSDPLKMEHMASPELGEMLWEHVHGMIELLASVLREGASVGTMRSDTDPDELAHIIIRILSTAADHQSHVPDSVSTASQYTDVVNRVVAPQVS